MRSKINSIPFVHSVFHPTDFSPASNLAFAHALAIALLRETSFLTPIPLHFVRNHGAVVKARGGGESLRGERYDTRIWTRNGVWSIGFVRFEPWYDW